MKIRTWSSVALAFALSPIFYAGAQTRYNTQSVGTVVRLDGTSSAHEWEMEGSTIGGYIVLGSGVALDQSQADPTGLQDGKISVQVHAHIPVATIHSKADHLPQVMDDLMKKHMKAADFPIIEYTITELTLKGPHTGGQPFNFDAKGELAIAGKTNQVTFPVTIATLENDKIKISGTAAVKMTDYGVEPPAPDFGLGLMKCGDDVKIQFDWMLKKKK